MKARGELLAAAAAAFSAADAEREQNYCGLAARAERMTDLLIEAMFPRCAAQAAPAVERLEQAAALLHTCTRGS